jgi:HEAT repeat protein
MKSITYNSARSRPAKGAALVFALGLGTLACQVRHEDLANWSRTPTGPRKIRVALGDSSQTFAVRVEAGVLLAELGLIGPLFDDLFAIEEAERKKLVGEILGLLSKRMAGATPAATTSKQMTSKDALFSVCHPIATGEDKKTKLAFPVAACAPADRQLAAWLAADWRKRSGGTFSGRLIVAELGAVAAEALATSIATTNAKSLHEIVPLIRLSQSVRAIDITSKTLINLGEKERTARASTFKALGGLRSEQARAYLVKLATSASASRRIQALRALRYDRHPSLVPMAAALVGNAKLLPDQKETRGVQEAALELLEGIDHPDAATALSNLLAHESSDVRLAAAGALIVCCKAAGAMKLLAGLSSRYSYKEKDIRGFVESPLRELGGKALPALRAGLKSPSWIGRVVAVRMLGEFGSRDDIAALKLLQHDDTPLRGWGTRATVATETKSALAAIEKRLK